MILRTVELFFFQASGPRYERETRDQGLAMSWLDGPRFYLGDVMVEWAVESVICAGFTLVTSWLNGQWRV